MRASPQGGWAGVLPTVMGGPGLCSHGNQPDPELGTSDFLPVSAPAPSSLPSCLWVSLFQIPSRGEQNQLLPFLSSLSFPLGGIKPSF